MYGLTIVTAPAAEPVGVEEMKLWLRVDTADDDELIAGLIAAARGTVETITHRQLVTATWRLSFRGFPGQVAWPAGFPDVERQLAYSNSSDAPVTLPKPPVQSITSFTYVNDETGLATVVTSAEYELDNTREPALLWPAYNTSWPSARDKPNSVLVTYTAGYGPAASVPEGLRLAIKQLVAYWYGSPEVRTNANPKDDVPMYLRRMLRQFCYGDLR